ncbi:MAG: NADH-quinone oxidoreductase subunit G [Actinomycetaceae bacterium]|nr:NADH-quinone oxidoreductase subunit G [Arcanobacterium sp.]MDD7686973.1 NADH-quinone oxidoreductase subunit G [Actinomycetaceae bacterium]MDY5273372.1 NADH-quinone oxidoreductase subunit G [Arcanobacterium sp.]
MTAADTATDLITVKIDGTEVQVPSGTLVIRAAEQAGVYIPRFCDHPLLKPAAACRQCLVEIATPNRQGEIAKMPKPQAACSMTVSPGMEVYTQRSSEVAKKAQQGVMEFMLINHPMDCPVCDKGGECPLQNQQLEEGRTHTRFEDIKRTYPKPISVSDQILLDRDRCILCQRCVRFQDQIAGDPFIQLQGRGGGTPAYGNHGLHGSQIGNFDAGVLDFAASDGGEEPRVANTYSGPQGEAGLRGGFAPGPLGNAEADVNGKPFNSYFSGNIIQICPVGALTSASYRFRARPFDLVSVPSVTEHDASGSAIRVDYRRGEIVRRMALEDPEVNEDWITDKDRFAFRWQHGDDRLMHPVVAGTDPETPVSWFEAIETAAHGLRGKRVGVLVGGRLPLEDAYAYAKFARVVLGTNDIDFRTRAGSAEEDAFLASIAGSGLSVTYSQVEHAKHVLTVGLEVEDEIGALFLRLRKGVTHKTTSVSVVSTYRTRGTAKLDARFIPAKPGEEAAVLESITATANGDAGALFADLSGEGAVILVGERAAQTAGTLSAACRLAQRTGARLAWVPRRAGDRGALEAGALPGLLPGGRPVADSAARVDVAATWGVETLPQEPGRNTADMLAAAAAGELDALILAGVELADLPVGAADALEKAFVVQLEVRRTATTELADVVLPVAPPSEKGGTFVNWEGRMRPFGQVLTSTVMPDRSVLNDLAHAMGVELGLDSLDRVVNEFAQLREWDGIHVSAPDVPAASVVSLPAGSVLLASWKQMLDAGSLQSFEPHLAATARKAVAIMSPATAVAAGFTPGGSTSVEIVGSLGSITLPAVVDESIPDGVVWVPENSTGSQIAQIGVCAGQSVSIKKTEVAA